MRILLVGEYSGFHNALKYGLEQLGHEVCLVGDGDGFKQYPVDIHVGSRYYQSNWWREKLKVAWYLLTKKNLEDRLRLKSFNRQREAMTGYDVVQFINSNPFGCEPDVEWQMLQHLIQHNKQSVLVACGDDCEYSQYLTERHQGYSILTPVKEDQSQKKHLWHTYKYLGNGFRQNYHRLLAACSHIVPSNADYHMALQQQPKATDIIPAPVVWQKFDLTQNNNTRPIQIFLGINEGSAVKKGIVYFEKALDILQRKYGEQINITIARSLPYNLYIRKYEKAHILLDQVLCYDQGYNALEAMAQGKVVFAGADTPYGEAHQKALPPLMDARPDVDYLVESISQLIEQPERIFTLGQQARAHIIDYHDAVKVAKQYISLYENK